jgi:hypothetical protein
MRSAFFIIVTYFMSGCAILYHDTKTDTQHLIGFGHMKMRINSSQENIRSKVFGLDTIGVSFGSSPGGKHASLGWQSLKSVQITDDSAVRLEWSTDDPFSIRAGTYFPQYLLNLQK